MEIQNNALWLYLAGEISMSHDNLTNHFIKRTREEDKNKEKIIYVLIDSSGGDSNAASSIYLQLRKMKTEGWKIITIGDHSVKSGAFLIYLVGEERLLYPKTRMMYHEHFKLMNLELKINKREDLINFAKEYNLFEDADKISKNNQRINEEICKISSVSLTELKSIEGKELNVSSAIKLGFATKIIKD